MKCQINQTFVWCHLCGTKFSVCVRLAGRRGRTGQTAPTAVWQWNWSPGHRRELRGLSAQKACKTMDSGPKIFLSKAWCSLLIFFNPLTPQPSEKVFHLSPKKSFHSDWQDILQKATKQSGQQAVVLSLGPSQQMYAALVGGRQCDSLEKTHR